jgi:hypothetical protein
MFADYFFRPKFYCQKSLSVVIAIGQTNYQRINICAGLRKIHQRGLTEMNIHVSSERTTIARSVPEIS